MASERAVEMPSAATARTLLSVRLISLWHVGATIRRRSGASFPKNKWSGSTIRIPLQRTALRMSESRTACKYEIPLEFRIW